MIWAALPALAAGAYYLLALVAALRHRPRPAPPTNCPPISILKPVHGRDPRMYEAFRSHAIQDYPEFEMLFGVSDPADAAIEDIRRLAAEFPERQIRLIIARPGMPNAKVGLLAELARHARHPVLLVNDSDIEVEPGYLRSLVACLDQPGIGLVTALYRATSESWPSRFEAIGIETEFAPSILVARMLGVVEFALGSTMAFRADVLRKAGGFEAIGDFIADDYQLGKHISALGYRIAFANTVVATDLGGETWGEVWRHQLRWSRTIRVSRPAGYAGYVITHATLWSALAIAGGAWPLGIAVLVLRIATGVLVGCGILRDRRISQQFWLIPIRDLLGFAVWVVGLFGTTVEWRGERLILARDGRIRTHLN